MKVLSIRQPWAWCIIHAGKDIENRDWRTPFRGRFLVHAGKGMTRAEYEDCLETLHAVSGVRRFPRGLTLPPFGDLERGGVVGSVDLVDCVEHSDSPWFFGRYGFVLRDPAPFPFFKMTGQLGFFDRDFLSLPSPERTGSRASTETKDE